MCFFVSFFSIQWFPTLAHASALHFIQYISQPIYAQKLFNRKLVSRAKILGNAEIFVKSGSDINLTCVAVHSPTPPSFIYWYKEGRVINYSQRGGISVLTERKTRTSKLVISKAMSSDSGNYTCIPSSSGKFGFLFFFHFYHSTNSLLFQHSSTPIPLVAFSVTFHL